MSPSPPRSLPPPAAAARAELIPASLQKSVNDAFHTNRWPVYLFGETGVGKTCIAGLCYRRWRGTAVWLSGSKMLRQVAGCRRSPDIREAIDWLTDAGEFRVDPQDFWDAIVSYGLVVIDDIGVKDATEAQREVFTEILDRRVDKPLLLTGNIEPHNLNQVFDGRVQSRCCAGALIRVVRGDLRVEGAQVQEFRA